MMMVGHATNSTPIETRRIYHPGGTRRGDEAATRRPFVKARGHQEAIVRQSRSIRGDREALSASSCPARESMGARSKRIEAISSNHHQSQAISLALPRADESPRRTSDAPCARGAAMRWRPRRAPRGSERSCGAAAAAVPRGPDSPSPMPVASRVADSAKGGRRRGARIGQRAWPASVESEKGERTGPPISIRLNRSQPI